MPEVPFDNVMPEASIDRTVDGDSLATQKPVDGMFMLPLCHVSYFYSCQMQ